MSELTSELQSATIAADVAKELYAVELAAKVQPRLLGRVIANGVDVIREAEGIVAKEWEALHG